MKPPTTTTRAGHREALKERGARRIGARLADGIGPAVAKAFVGNGEPKRRGETQWCWARTSSGRVLLMYQPSTRGPMRSDGQPASSTAAS